VSHGTEALIQAAVEAAEEFRDPLARLVERTAADAGAPLSPDVLTALAALKRENPAAFETLRAQLKKVGCRVGGLDKALRAEAGASEGGRGRTQTEFLIELAAEAEFFHTPDDTAFADLEVDGHRETYPVASRGFRRWLSRRYFDAHNGAPGKEAFQAALSALEAKAYYDGLKRDVFVRVGAADGKVYLDLCDDTWRAVEISTEGWRVISHPPVRFRRSAGMKPLPIPQRGGSIEGLRAYLNVGGDTDFVLVVAWALAVLRHQGPYPLLALAGEQGSAKSTFSAVLRALLDPNTAPLRALPREDRDLFIAARNGHLLAFDNISGLPGWISDTLCRLATGGGFAVRQLYSDQDEVLFDAARPLILNGIEDMVTRPDLADRAIFLNLRAIPEETRLPERALWAAFERDRPRLLGALLDGVAAGLRNLPQVRLERLPRMADFAIWAAACETAYWPAGTFAQAYAGNREEAVEGVIDADPVAGAIRTMMAEQTGWTGTSSQLLAALNNKVSEEQRKADKEWPKTARALSGRLRRAATFLRKLGLEVSFEREGRSRTRRILITTAADNEGIFASTPSAPSAAMVIPLRNNNLSPADPRTVGPDADGMRTNREHSEAVTVCAKRLNLQAMTAADGADAKIPQLSEPDDDEAPGWQVRL
jgi:hypothetical protein